MRLNGTQPNMKEVTTMQTMVPLYGFGGGSGGTGAALTVTAPAGATVTVSKDSKSKTKVADLDGVAVFKGLSSGDWLLSITDGTQTAQKTVTITADYTTAITFFAATIHITYPAGSTCTATDGVTTIHAPDDSGTWDCVVENAGLWTVSLDSGFAETIDVTTSGETYTIDRWYLYNQGDEHEAITGGWSTDGYTGVGKQAEKYETYIHIKYASGEYEIGTQNAIPFSGFSKLCVDVPEMTGLLYLAANATKVLDQYNATHRLDIKNTAGVSTMAIDNQTSSFYVELGPSKGSGCNARVSKVWLEV